MNILKKMLFLLILQSFAIAQYDFLYDKMIDPFMIKDVFNNDLVFPDSDLIDVVFFLKPSNPHHINQLEKIGFIVEEFHKSAKLWVVCGDEPNKNEVLRRWNWIGSESKKISSLVEKHYCPDCMSLLLIKNNRIKFLSASFSIDFLREWLMENVKNEN